MVAAWYPKHVRSPEDRLRYYASVFDTVEIDSTFYGLPQERVARLWASRTPENFVFLVKAFAMMTRHPVRPDQLPKDLAIELSSHLDEHGRISSIPEEIRKEVFGRFLLGLRPLLDQEKVGAILLQFPPYIRATPKARAYIEMAVELLRPLPVAVEFRHASWLSEHERTGTFAFLEAIGAAYVCVDEPRIPSANVLPPVAACTTPDLAYVRFHGRNAATWNARSIPPSERFRYLYTEDELREWVEPIRSLQEQAKTTYVMFNNCYGDYAPRNALQMLSLLDVVRE